MTPREKDQLDLETANAVELLLIQRLKGEITTDLCLRSIKDLMQTYDLKIKGHIPKFFK